MQKIVFTQYTPQYKDSLLSLLSLKWDGLSTAEIKEKFEWRYEHNPHNSNKPCIYVACKDNQVIGFRAFVVQHFSFNGVLYKVYNPADAIVHPNYRRMGIFAKLNDTFLNDLQGEEKSLIFNTSSNQYSSPGNLKQNWQAIHYVNRYGYKFSLNLRFGNLPSLQHKNELINSVNNLYKRDGVVSSQTLLHKELSSLNFALRKQLPNQLIHIRDEKFYLWRYALNKKDYYFVYYYYEQQLDGYLILRKISNRKMIIEEYFAQSNSILKCMVRKVLKANNLLMIRMHIFSEKEALLLRRIGFVIEPVKLMNKLGKIRLPFLVRPAILHPKDSDFLLHNKFDIRDPNLWIFDQSVIH